MKKNVKIIGCGNGDKNKTLEEDCANNFEEIDFEFVSPGTPNQTDIV